MKNITVIIILLLSFSAFSQQNAELQKDWNAIKNQLKERSVALLDLKKSIENAKIVNDSITKHLGLSAASLLKATDIQEYDNEHINIVKKKNEDLKKSVSSLLSQLKKLNPEDKEHRAIITKLGEILQQEISFGMSLMDYNEKCEKSGRKDLKF